MTHKNLLRLILFLQASVLSAVAQAEIYKWVDDQGKAHFTDAPPEGIKTETVDLKINTYTAVEITPLVERLGKEGKVVIYSAAWCRVCKKAEQYFREKHIPYINYDVEKSPTGRIDFKALGGKSVPVLIIGKTRMNGFTVSKFEKVYQKEMQANLTPAPALTPTSPPAPAPVSGM